MKITTSKIENINDWVLKRKQEWNQHKNLMREDRLVRISKDKSPYIENTTSVMAFSIENDKLNVLQARQNIVRG